jgi:hypothetical protein
LRPVVLVVLVALAACSGGSHPTGTAKAGEPATFVTPTTHPFAASHAERVKDTHLAKKMVVHGVDLPGWKVQAGVREADGEATFARLCKPLARTRRDIEKREGGPLPSASSAFVKSTRGLPVVRSKVYVVSERGLATLTFGLLSSPAYARCIAKSFTDPTARPSKVRYGKPRTRAAAIGRIGEEASAWRITVPTTSGGVAFTTHLDLVVVRRVRAVHLLLLGDADLLPLSPRSRLAILRAVARRLQAT